MLSILFRLYFFAHVGPKNKRLPPYKNMKFAEIILIFEMIDIHEIFSIEWGSYIITAVENRHIKDDKQYLIWMFPIFSTHNYNTVLK